MTEQGFKKRATAIAAAASLLTVLMIWFGLGAISRMEETERLWRDFNHENTAAAHQLAEFNQEIGFGGFIHLFKNYLLRRDPLLGEQVQNSLDRLRHILDDYEAIPLIPKERAALQVLRQHIQVYTEKFDLARELIQSGLSAREIDARVKVDDQPALKAMRFLSSHVIDHSQAMESETQGVLDRATRFLMLGGVLVPLFMGGAILLIFLLRQMVEAHRRLNETRREVDAILEGAPDATLCLNREGRFIRVNARAAQLFGHPRHAFQELTLEDLIPERFRERHVKIREAFFAQPDARFMGLGMGVTGVTGGGREFPAEITLNTLEQDGELLILAAVRDISERLKTEGALQQTRRALTARSRCNLAITRATDEKTLLEEVCRIMVETAGYRMAWIGIPENNAERTVRSAAQAGFEEGYLDRISVTWDDMPTGRGPMGTAIRTGAPLAIRNVHSDPLFAPWREEAVTRGYASVLSLPLGTSGERIGGLAVYAEEVDAFDEEEEGLLLSLAHDITYGIIALRESHRRAETEASLRQSEQLLLHTATHDALTELPNRDHLLVLMQGLTGRSDNDGEGFMLAVLGLDGFKKINDSLGFSQGDRVLQRMAARLREAGGEDGVLARLGSDEFALLKPNVCGAGEAEQLIRRALAAIARPQDIRGHDVRLTASAGYALHPECGPEATQLLKFALIAMQRAKKSGSPGTVQAFTPDMDQAAGDRLTLESDMRRALTRGDFFLTYQPKIDRASGRVAGMETLVRWRHMEKGIIPPGRFIPLAEESGLIAPLGDWILRETCFQNQRWREAGLNLKAAVNLSSVQFRQSALENRVEAALRDSGLPPEFLELEITESMMMGDVKQAIDTLETLKNLGVSLSIDDFGTGYSSLEYLKQFPIDALKIDQSFVRDLAADSQDARIVSAIIAMAHSLNLAVVAEGVETPEQNAFLGEEGCDLIQGYYFSKPLEADDFLLFAQENLNAPPPP